MILLEGKNICFSHGRTCILQHIDFTLKQGNLTAVMGANGAGKTTLLKILAGLQKPSQGTVRLGNGSVGIAALPIRTRARHIAYIPQLPETDLPFSVYDFVAMGRNPHHRIFGNDLKEDNECIKAALSALDLEALAEKDMAALSGGERQRAAIARALCQDTPILLADEPTASLDYQYQVLAMELFRKHAEQGKGVVLVTHDLNLAASYADMVYFLQKGRCVGFGTPAEVLTKDFLQKMFKCSFHIDMRQGIPHIYLDTTEA